MRKGHPAHGEVRLQDGVRVVLGRVVRPRLGSDGGDGRVLALEMIDEDDAAAGGIGARGDAERGHVALGQAWIIVAAGQQRREALREAGRPARKEVERTQLARFADGGRVIVGRFERVPGVAEIGAAVRHVIVVPRTAEGDGLPGTTRLSRPPCRVPSRRIWRSSPSRTRCYTTGKGWEGNGRLARGVVAVVQAGVEHGNFDPVGPRLVIEVFEVRVVHVRSPAAGMFVFELEQEDVAAVIELVFERRSPRSGSCTGPSTANTGPISRCTIPGLMLTQAG